MNARDVGVIISRPERRGQDCGCALVHVDGFDNSLAEARENFAHIGEAYDRAGGRCELYGFAWRSDPGLLFLTRAEREADEHAGAALASFLDTLSSSSCPARKISLTAHSLGSRVVLRALEQRVRGDGLPIEMVALVAPAVALADLIPGGALHRGFGGTRRLFILRNSEDYVQGIFYPLLTGGRRSIGQHGLRSMLESIVEDARSRGVELVELDFAELWGPRHSALANLDERFWAFYLSLGG